MAFVSVYNDKPKPLKGAGVKLHEEAKVNMPIADERPRSPAGAADETSLTLLSRVRQADQAAWTRLVDLYGPLVFDWCLRAGLKSSDAADVGQEVFTRVWRSVKEFRRERPGDSFRAWLRVITRRQLLDFWRREKRRPHVLDAAAVSAWPDDFQDEEDAAQLAQDRLFLHQRAVALLRTDFEPITVEAFWRVVVEGELPRDVASRLGMSLNAVYIAKSRVLARLRVELADD
jgi:RNA polymerase sigma-70 factor (ECF subfamily)